MQCSSVSSNFDFKVRVFSILKTFQTKEVHKIDSKNDLLLVLRRFESLRAIFPVFDYKTFDFYNKYLKQRAKIIFSMTSEGFSCFDSLQ